jgi:F-type H+-transporting ATPase subunit alpha
MSSAPDMLHSALEQAFTGMREARNSFSPPFSPHEVGVVTNVSTGIATFSGFLGDFWALRSMLTKTKWE